MANPAAELKYGNLQAMVVLHSRRLFYHAMREGVTLLLISLLFPLFGWYYLLHETLFPEWECRFHVSEMVQMLSCFLSVAFIAAVFLLPGGVLLPLAAAWAVAAGVAGVGCFVLTTTRARAEMCRSQAEWLSVDTPAVGNAPTLQAEEGGFIINASERGLYLVDCRVSNAADLPPAEALPTPAPAYYAAAESGEARCCFIYRLEAGLHRLPAELQDVQEATLMFAPYREQE